MYQPPFHSTTYLLDKTDLERIYNGFRAKKSGTPSFESFIWKERGLEAQPWLAVGNELKVQCRMLILRTVPGDGINIRAVLASLQVTVAETPSQRLVFRSVAVLNLKFGYVFPGKVQKHHHLQMMYMRI